MIFFLSVEFKSLLRKQKSYSNISFQRNQEHLKYSKFKIIHLKNIIFLSQLNNYITYSQETKNLVVNIDKISLYGILLLLTNTYIEKCRIYIE